ncbi:MAG: beta-propeller fold lactonase family protein [Burkholderiales bacterium]|nr:beta-propeller fold lactonase family protein [Burkholderiales bacterium]
MLRPRILPAATLLHLMLCLAPVAANADLAVLVGNKSEASVDLLDLDTGKRRARFPTGDVPHEITVSPDRRWAVVTNYGPRDRPGNTLTVIDWVAGAVARTVDLGENGGPHGIAFLPNARTLIVTTEANGTLTEVDVVDGRVLRTIDVGGQRPHMLVLSPDARHAYVTRTQAGAVTVVDLRAGRVVADIPTGAGAEGISITPDGRELWISNAQADTVSVIDTEALAVVATVPTEGFPIRTRITPDGRHVLVLNAKAATIRVFDRAERQALHTIALAKPGVVYGETIFGIGPLPIGIQISPDGQRAIAAISGGDEVAVIDTETWAIVQRWPTGREPDGMSFLPGMM